MPWKPAGEGANVRTSVAVSVSPNVLVTVIVTLKVPLTVGVPEITPVDESIVTPFGSPVAPKVNAFVAVTVYENAVSSAPPASSVAFVITGTTVLGATTRVRVYTSPRPRR